MESKDLVLIKGENEVYWEKRRHRADFKRTLKHLFCIVLLAGALLCAFFLLPRANALFGSGAFEGFISNLGISIGKKPPSDTGSNQGNVTQGGASVGKTKLKAQKMRKQKSPRVLTKSKAQPRNT